MSELSLGELSTRKLSTSELSTSDLIISERSTSELSISELSTSELSISELSTSMLSMSGLSLGELNTRELSTSELSTSELSTSELSISELSTSRLRIRELSTSRLRKTYNALVSICVWPHFRGVEHIFSRGTSIANKNIQKVLQPGFGSLAPLTAPVGAKPHRREQQGRPAQLRVQNLARHPSWMVGLYLLIAEE